jgi:hypothetical protein
MRGRLALAAGVFVALVAAMAMPGAGQQWRDHQLLLKVGDKAFRYNHEQLRAMATTQIGSNRGIKMNPAIPLEALLTRDTKLPMDRVVGVIVVGAQKILFLEGDNLQQVPHLVLKFGPNHLTLVPASEDAYERNRALWGKPRIEDVERIDILERR